MHTRGCVCTLCLEEVVHKDVCMCVSVHLSLLIGRNEMYVIGISIYCLKYVSVRILCLYV